MDKQNAKHLRKEERVRVFFDIETTGLDYLNNCLITAHFCTSEGDSIDIKARYTKNYSWDTGAQDVHKITMPEAMSFNDRKSESIRLRDWLMKYKGELWAHCNDNGRQEETWFDYAFVWEFLGEEQYKVRPRFESMTTIKLLRSMVKYNFYPAIKIRNKRGALYPTYKLSEWAKYFNMYDEDMHHDAKYDAEVTMKIFQKCRKDFCKRVENGLIKPEAWKYIK